MSDHDNLTQKAKGSSKADQSLLKHNRNASAGIKLTNREEEAAIEQRAADRIAKRGKRPSQDRGRKRADERLRDTIVELRRQGRTYANISMLRGMPDASTIGHWIATMPEFAEAVKAAYDDHIRNLVESSLMVDEIDDAPGISNDVLGWVEPQKIGKRDAAEVIVAKLAVNAAYVGLAVRHGRGRSLAKTARIKTAIVIAEHRLPAEWGRDRDQEQEVIVIETPGGWMIEAATAGVHDADGQGPEAAAAAIRWSKERDVTP